MAGKTNCLETKIKRYFGDSLSNCLEYTLDQTLAQYSEGVCCLLARDAPWRSGLPLAVTAQVIGSSAFLQAGLCSVCHLRYSRMGCNSSVCSLLTHAARLCLPCKGMSH